MLSHVELRSLDIPPTPWYGDCCGRRWTSHPP